MTSSWTARVLPILMGGLLMGAHRVYNGGKFEVSCVFDAFTRHPASLALLGVAITLAAMIPAVVMVSLLFLLETEPGLWLVGGIAILVSLPTFAILTLGTLLIAVGEEPLLHALKLTMIGTYRNIVAILLYLIGSTVLLIAGAAALGISMLITLPIVFAGGYASYRDIYD